MRSLILGLVGAGALTLGACALSTPSSAPPGPPMGCAQEVIDRGAGWQEVGGPRAFVLACPVIEDPIHPCKVMVRFEEDLEPPFLVDARMGDGTLREKGSMNDEIERDDWAAGHGPPSDLSGSVHLVILLFPRPGCWEVTLSAGGDVAGTAWIEVQARAEQEPSPGAGSEAPP